MKDLITDSGTGQLSHTKIWANVAYASATVGFLYAVYKGTATSDIWFVYLGIVGASATASKLLSLKFGSKKE